MLHAYTTLCRDVTNFIRSSLTLLHISSILLKSVQMNDPVYFKGVYFKKYKKLQLPVYSFLLQNPLILVKNMKSKTILFNSRSKEMLINFFTL